MLPSDEISRFSGEVLRRSAEARNRMREWNQWRFTYGSERVLNLTGVLLVDADLTGAYLSSTKLASVILADANLAGANLTDVSLFLVDLSRANLTGANLTGADLTGANLTGANLTGARVHDIITDDIEIDGAIQLGLIVTQSGLPDISVDDLEMAQFICLLLGKKTSPFQAVIDSMRQKSVLILGRFTDKRLSILDLIRDGLRERKYMPVLFTFAVPGDLTYTEVARVVAGLSKFIVVDLTEERSVPQELQAIVPNCPSVPVQPIVQKNYKEWTISQDFQEYPWYLKIYRYSDRKMIKRQLEACIIAPAEAKLVEIQQRRKEHEIL